MGRRAKDDFRWSFALLGGQEEKHMSNKNKKSDWALIDLVIPLFAFCLAAYYLYTLRDLPTLAKYYGGAIAVLIFLCFAATVCVFFKRKMYLQCKELKKLFQKETYFRDGGGTAVALELLGITILYVGAIKLLGFTAATFLYLCVVMLFLGRRGIWKILLPAAGVTLVGYVLFVIILNLNINLDPVSKSLKYIIRGWVF